MQESSRKDVERAFGVLQARWRIVWSAAMTWDSETLWQLMTCCVIPHNVIVEDEGDGVALIRLQRIYNFLLFQAIIVSILDVLYSFTSNFMRSINFGTNLLTECPVSSSVFYFAEYQYQTKSKCHKLFGDFFWWERTLEASGAHKRRPMGPTRYQGTPGAPDVPWWVVDPTGTALPCPWLYKYSKSRKPRGVDATLFQSQQVP